MLFCLIRNVIIFSSSTTSVLQLPTDCEEDAARFRLA
jgi:hypothetical protein